MSLGEAVKILLCSSMGKLLLVMTGVKKGQIYCVTALALAEQQHFTVHSGSL